MRDFMATAKALGDENRVRILCALEAGELCVCQLIELLGLAASTVSKHLAILKAARLIEARKEGRWMFYRIAEEDLPPSVLGALAWIHESLARETRIRNDRKRLKAILREDPEDLCRRQCCR